MNSEILILTKFRFAIPSIILCKSEPEDHGKSGDMDEIDASSLRNSHIK